MGKKFSETNTRNARIKIDYRGEKPRVNFSYPNIKNYSEGSALEYVLLFWLITFSAFVIFAFSLGSSNTNQIGAGQIIWVLLKLSLGLTLLLAPPIILNKVFNKQLKKLYPKLQKIWAVAFEDHYSITINKNNIKTEGGKIYAEVPLFSNTFLDYEAKGDFGKNLDYLEIKEWNVKAVVHIGKKEESALDLFWYARFYFNEEPKMGGLKIRFK